MATCGARTAATETLGACISDARILVQMKTGQLAPTVFNIPFLAYQLATIKSGKLVAELYKL